MTDAQRQTGEVVRRRGPRAFTLVEMLVSVAILGVALTVVGMAFSVTVNTTRTAAAYSQAQNYMRQFVTQIEEDLRHCDPARSLLVIAGRTQGAARNRDELEAGKYWRVLVGDPAALKPDEYAPQAGGGTENRVWSDPRADILMFFAHRPTTSMAPPINPAAGTFGAEAAEGARFPNVQVVYGHAALGEAVSNADGSVAWPLDEALRHIEEDRQGNVLTNTTRLSGMPLTEWHLSRRAVVVRPRSTTVTMLDDVRFELNARRGIASGATYTSTIQAGAPWCPGDGAYLSLDYLLENLGPAAIYLGTPVLAPGGPYVFDTHPQWGYARPVIQDLLYSPIADALTLHHVATVIPSPPTELKSNLGLHLLPACAWFQVEFLMPEDPRNSIHYADPTPRFSLDNFATRWDTQRWVLVPDNMTYVFVPDTAENRAAVAGEPVLSGRRIDDYALLVPPTAGGVNMAGNRVIRMWPYAIRITVRVLDSQGILTQPIERTIVHSFENG